MAPSTRLLRRAEGTGWRARLAVRRLLRAGERRDLGAIRDLWDLWLRTPREDVGAALVRWQQPSAWGGLSRVALGLPAPPEDVVEAARREGHPVAAIARAGILAGHQDLVDAVCEAAMSDTVLARFCIDHQLAPREAHRAAVYFLLTGQHDQYRLSDPDHSLLALAYQGAGDDERALVRTAAAAHPDLVRVLADTVRRGRMSRLGQDEARYLVDLFAGRQDWPGLWELAKDLPVLDAVGAVRRCADWRPDGTDSTLFDALAGADPTELAAAYSVLVMPWTVPAPGTVTGGSITPDGRRFAVTTTSTVDSYTLLPGQEPVTQDRMATEHNSEVLALDDDALVVSDWGRAARGFSSIGYVWTSNDKAGIVKFHRAAAFSLAGDGFAALTYEGERRRPALYLVTGSGRDFAKYGQRAFDLIAELGIPAGDRSWTVAGQPGSDVIAVAGHGLHLARITEAGLRPLASAPFTAGARPYAAFTGPDRLITLAGTELSSWRRDGDALHVVAERTIPGSTVAALPGAGVIATIEWPDSTRRQLRYLDGETLADLPLPTRFGREQDPTALFASPDGHRLGIGFHGFANLLDVGLTTLAGLPLAATTPADLRRLHARKDSGWARPGAKPLLELLYTCLVHRFEEDVTLGRATPLLARGDDIVLGGAP